MVRGKKSRKSELSTVSAEGTKSLQRPVWRFSFIDYAVVSVFFIIFCYLQKYVALYWFGVLNRPNSFESTALDFFFDTMWIGFVIVAFLTWLHDFIYRDAEEEENDSA